MYLEGELFRRKNTAFLEKADPRASRSQKPPRTDKFGGRFKMDGSIHLKRKSSSE